MSVLNDNFKAFPLEPMLALLPSIADDPDVMTSTPNIQRAADACWVCGNIAGNRLVFAKEQMFGTGQRFTYLHCGGCGVLHLLHVPMDMSRYYPRESYYSVHSRARALRGAIKRWRDRAHAGPSPLGRWLAAYAPNIALDAMLRALPNRQARVLDVGCGDGQLLSSMARVGYSQLTGIDPLIGSTRTIDGVRLQCGELASVEGVFDLISFHHSLEHIVGQVEVLTHARQLLAPGGRLLIRVPTCESFAFEVYGADWVQLDAPRHIFLHSHRSIARVAEDAGLRVERLYCDSQPMQFWGSDMYRDGVPLMSGQIPRYKRRNAGLYKRMSTWLNAHLRGDQIVLTLVNGLAAPGSALPSPGGQF